MTVYFKNYLRWQETWIMGKVDRGRYQPQMIEIEQDKNNNIDKLMRKLFKD